LGCTRLPNGDVKTSLEEIFNKKTCREPFYNYFHIINFRKYIFKNVSS